MWRLCAVVIASLALVIPSARAQRAGDADKGAGDTKPKIALFVTRLSSDLHAPFEMVLKISNPAQERVTIDAGVPVHYHFSPPPGTKMAIEDKTGIASPPQDSAYYLTFEVTLPGVHHPKHGAWQQPLWLKGRGQNLVLEPDGSFLVAMDFPADTLVAGDCIIKLALSHGGQVEDATEGIVVSVK